MAGFGIGPAQFAPFGIADRHACARALEGELQPALLRVGGELAAGLSRVVGGALTAEPGRITRRRDAPPGEVVVAFAAAPPASRNGPRLELAVSRGHLHARVEARASADRDGAMRRALEREAVNLARKGRPFRALRSYEGWDFEHLPEIAPAHAPGFWSELAAGLGGERGGLSVGIAWTAEEARNLAVGDVLGTFRDLAPLYKLLANAG
jgi:hypothetical protein